MRFRLRGHDVVPGRNQGLARCTYAGAFLRSRGVGIFFEAACLRLRYDDTP
jgi:hypothetical protein